MNKHGYFIVICHCKVGDCQILFQTLIIISIIMHTHVMLLYLQLLSFLTRMKFNMRAVRAGLSRPPSAGIGDDNR